MIHFLKFPDQPAFESLLIPAEGTPGERRLVAPPGLSIDVIGTIYQGGAYAADGTVITPPTALDGYHVNALGDLPGTWLQYAIPAPATPVRVFAGVSWR